MSNIYAEILETFNEAINNIVKDIKPHSKGDIKSVAYTVNHGSNDVLIESDRTMFTIDLSIDAFDSTIRFKVYDSINTKLLQEGIIGTDKLSLLEENQVRDYKTFIKDSIYEIVYDAVVRGLYPKEAEYYTWNNFVREVV